MSAPLRLFVPRDAAALSVGAEAVAAAVMAESQRRSMPVELVRNGSRGLFWLEPLLEVATPGGRVGFGRVSAEDVPGLFDAGFHDGGPHPLCIGLVDRLPWLESQQRWSFGRVTLLGDAAHPMYPIGSNGASQAILDAPALTEALTTESDIVSALQQYERARLQPTARIVLSNRQQGPEQVMQLVEERAPTGFTHLHEVISQAELEEIANRYKQIAGLSREELNAKHVN